MQNKTIIVALLLMNLQSSFAQDMRIPTTMQKKVYRETMDDPYLPNQYDNQKTSSAYRYTNNASRLSAAASTIVTVQVNVNGSGQNIVGDAANEPSIAVNPLNLNEIVIGWRQFDDVSSNFRQAGWAYSSDGGESWTFPGTIATGTFRSDPVLGYSSDGIFYYNSLGGSFECYVHISANGGVSWNSGTYIGGGDKQWMAIDRTDGVGSGNIYSSWTAFYSFCSPGFFTRSTTQGASYEDCIPVDGAPYWVNMTVGLNGELYIAGADTGNYGMRVVKSFNAQIPNSSITWDASVYVDLDGYLNGWLPINPMGLLGMAYIDVDRSNGPGRGNVYLLASVTRLSNGDPADVMFSRSTDGGLTWSPPKRINDDVSVTNYQWFGTMSVAPNGRIDAAWLDTRDAPLGTDSSALYYSYSLDQGNTWSPNERLSPLFDPHVGYPNQDKLGDYFHMISDNDVVHLAWAGTFNGEQDVYYSRITPGLVGINEHSKNASVLILPNPFSGSVTFVVDHPQLREGTIEVELYDVLGMKVRREVVHGSRHKLQRGNLPAGLYIYHLRLNGERIASGKLVAQ